jgi:DNA-directed RNA polymerase subunit RPC12/RpoP
VDDDELEVNCGYCGRRIVVRISEIGDQRFPKCDDCGKKLPAPGVRATRFEILPLSLN